MPFRYCIKKTYKFYFRITARMIRNTTNSFDDTNKVEHKDSVIYSVEKLQLA